MRKILFSVVLLLSLVLFLSFVYAEDLEKTKSAYIGDLTSYPEGYRTNIYVSSALTFTFDSQTYKFILLDTSEPINKALLFVNKDSQTINANVGEQVNFNLDSDSDYEMSVILESVTRNSAVLNIKEYSEKEIVNEEQEESVPEKESNLRIYYLIGAAILVVIVIIFIIYLVSSSKKNNLARKIKVR